MKKQIFRYENYGWGLFSLFIICLIPFLSPLICLISDNHPLTYLLVFVSIAGILYEFVPHKNVNNRLKIENIAIWGYGFAFIGFDFILLMLYAEHISFPPFIDYFLLGYVILPIILTIIEIYFSCKDYLDENNDKTQNKNNNEESIVIATGNAVKI